MAYLFQVIQASERQATQHASTLRDDIMPSDTYRDVMLRTREILKANIVKTLLICLFLHGVY